MCEAGQEGIISRRADAPYRGARTKNWLKVKCTRRQEFVIIGWTAERQGRAAASARCCSAVNEGDKLGYAGKVGTGFSQPLHARAAAKLRAAGSARPPPPKCRARRRAARIG